MFNEKEIPVNDFVSAISYAIDLSAPSLNNHHQRVAYISWKIAREMGLSDTMTQDILLAAKVHDIGAFSSKELTKMQAFETDDISMDSHALLGYKLLNGFEPLSMPALLIRHHHAHYDRYNSNIPLGSYVIFLADRVAVLFERNREILSHSPEIIAKITDKRELFHPIVFNAFERLSTREFFWVEAFSPILCASEVNKANYSTKYIDMDTFYCYARLLAQIIDFRSRFTATHSSGVAAVASDLTRIAGFSERESYLMMITGFLHDLGKLTVPSDILEKNGVLNAEEFNAIRKHTYYTYTILNSIQGMEYIAKIAAYHHERKNGHGYPFHIKAEEFSTMAQIMAVADVLTALSEDRPYRAGMNKEQTLKVLFEMTEKGAIDKSIVKMASDEFTHINAARIEAQKKALVDYKSFYSLNGADEGADANKVKVARRKRRIRAEKPLSKVG